MKIAIVDSNYLFRQGLRSILLAEKDFEVVGEGSCIEQGINLILKYRPNIVLMDLKLGEEDGLKISQEIRKKSICCKFIVLTDSSDYKDFRKVRENHIEGYIIKDALPEEIIYATRIIGSGKKYYDANLITSAMNLEAGQQFKDKGLKKLTQREIEVLMALGAGLSNSDISGKLSISESTVKKHVSNILVKLSLTDRTQAALYAAASELANN
jgi:DNA-binding NarL/FixJ family response regulator